jgi:hypothetical protein
LKFSTLGKRNVTESMNDDAMERGWSLMKMMRGVLQLIRLTDIDWAVGGWGARERKEKADLWILAFSNLNSIHFRKNWRTVLFFPVFRFHSTLFFIFRGAKKPPCARLNSDGPS